MKNVYYLMQELLQLLNNWCKTLCTNFTLKTEDNTKLSKLLSEGFKRPIYWNEYKVTPNKIAGIAVANREKHIRELLDSSCQGVKSLFVLAYDNTAGNNHVSVGSYKKYFLPKVKSYK